MFCSNMVWLTHGFIARVAFSFPDFEKCINGYTEIHDRRENVLSSQKCPAPPQCALPSRSFGRVSRFGSVVKRTLQVSTCMSSEVAACHCMTAANHCMINGEASESRPRCEKCMLSFTEMSFFLATADSISLRACMPQPSSFNMSG